MKWSAKMNELLPSHDPIDALGEAYEFLLEKALQKAHQSGNLVHHMIEESRGDIVALHKFSDNEIFMLEEYLKRDVIDAARYLDKTGKELRFWLGFAVVRVKHKFWEHFSEAANQTMTALNQLKQQTENAEYQTGELVGLGMLVCGQCGEKLHFHKPAHIPRCIKCNNTRFHRHNFE